MPGIAGVISKAEIDRGQLSGMAASMARRSDEVSATYVFESAGIGLGWVESTSPVSGASTAWSAGRNVFVAISGEMVSEKSAAESDASRLVQDYERRGVGFIEQLNGRFSGVLVDLAKRQVILFNDRYGLARIYLHETPEALYFASEAKALLAVVPTLRRLDRRGMAETFACGAVLQNRTLFDRLELLPGGSRWIFEGGGPPLKQRYFSPSIWEQQPKLGGAEFHERFTEVFATAVRRCLAGAGHAAMSLTGGLDGRMIMAWAGATPGELPCYSFNGPYRECSDVRIARRIAQICSQPHSVIGVGKEFIDAFGKLAEETVSISDGAMDVSGAVELYVNRLAREIAPVRITGNYGSEIVRRNVAFRPSKFAAGLLDPEFAREVEKARETYDAERACETLSFIAFKQVPWHHYSRLSIEQSQLSVRSPFLDNDLVQLMYRAPAELAASVEPTLELIRAGNPALAAVPTDRGLLLREPPVTGPLRRALTELEIRAEYAYDYGMPNKVAAVDHKLSWLHLERMFLGRHKFYHFRVWYRDQLAKYVEDVLLDRRSLERPYVRSSEVERIVRAHTSGRENWTKEIHRLLTLELLQRQLIEARS